MSLEILLPSAVVRLQESSPMLTLIGAGDLGEDFDPDAEFAEAVPWIFQGVSENFVTPFRDPVGTGKATITIASTRSWAVNEHNTANFPVLTVAIHADSTRDDSGIPVARDGLARALRIVEAVDAVFHDPANRKHDWPLGLTVYSSVRSADSEVTSIPKTDGMAFRAMYNYNLSI